MSSRTPSSRLPLCRFAGLALLLASSVAAAQAPSTAASAPAAKGGKSPQAAASSKAQPETSKQGHGQPIEIVADNLVVQQENRIAIFTGHVDAKQGGLRLRADQLKVFYNDPKAQAAAGGQQIRLIEASGNVVVIQHGDTAKGDHGTYRVADAAVTLDGNVVLTQGQNVVRGARLESNLNTGVSRVFAGQPGGAPGVSPEQRVRALFVPGQPGAATGGAPQAGGAGANKKPQTRPGDAAGIAEPARGGSGAGNPGSDSRGQ